MAAMFIDVPFALLAGLALSRGLFPETEGTGEFLGALAAVALGLSFVNHVIVVRLFRASLGKLVWGLRMVRVTDMRGPRLWQSVRRWLTGYFFFVFAVLLEDAGVLGEACGVRTVRRADLRS